MSLAFLALWLEGCGELTPRELAREEQFSVSLGRLETQIDLFQLGGRRLEHETALFMRDGTFYISNGSGHKIMRFSSYGDILLLLYDPSRNPEPVGLSLEGSGGNVASTRRGVAHELEDIGQIVVAGDDTIHVVAKAGRELEARDEELGILLDRIILRFDRQGRALPYLGRDGLGGIPFPSVEKLWMTAGGELVVVCMTAGVRLVYWFSAGGSLRYRVVLTESGLPERPEAGSVSVIASVAPDQSEGVLHVLVNRYRQRVDESTGSVVSLLPQGSRLYRLDLGSSRFVGGADLPSIQPRKTQYGGREYDIPAPPYELLGMTLQGCALLMRPTSQGVYELVALDREGRATLRRTIGMDDRELTYMTFHLSPQGVLSALLADTTAAHVVWWRCDRLFGAGRNG